MPAKPTNWGAKPARKAAPAAALDTFVSGKGPLKKLNLNIDAELHARFKSLCARRQTDMTEILVSFIEGWCDDMKMPS